MKLEPIDVGRLDVDLDLPNLHRDLHVFVDYVRGREIKRSHRGNTLSKADAKRLARLLSDSRAVRDVDEQGYSAWLEFVDDLALDLGFVHYDTEGGYAGYSSHERSYPDNYIEYRAKPYEKFLAATTADQEATLLDTLVQRDRRSANEFYHTGALGRLDGFNQWGSATGVMPTLDFPAIRRFLLRLLAECPPGQWLSTAALIDHLKSQHRYFLIPAKPHFKHEYERKYGRYGNFHESKETWGHEIDIHPNDPDGFERVEGRYVERFLEGIPLVLRYVDVAYAPKVPKGLYPLRDYLQAFRVSERLRRALEKRLAEPRVTVTPNFEVHILAETYPAGVLARLTPLCEVVTESTSVVLRLTKQKVAAARAAAPDLDAAGLLRELSGGALPANVAHELAAWSEHGEKFSLYGHCSLLETEQDTGFERFTVEHIAKGIRLVRSPDKLFDELERQGLMPVRIKHGAEALTPLPKSARTRFPKGAAGRDKPREPKPRVKLTRITRVLLVCPDRAFLDRLHSLLLESQCPVEVNRPSLTLAYSRQYESVVTAALRQLKTEYQVEIDDITS